MLLPLDGRMMSDLASKLTTWSKGAAAAASRSHSTLPSAGCDPPIDLPRLPARIRRCLPQADTDEEGRAEAALSRNARHLVPQAQGCTVFRLRPAVPACGDVVGPSSSRDEAVRRQFDDQQDPQSETDSRRDLQMRSRVCKLSCGEN